MKVKKVLAVMSLFLIFGSSLKAANSVCLGGGCVGVDVVTLANSTPTFTAISFVDGTTQTTAGGAAAAGGSASFFTFTENSGNKAAISSMTFESPMWSNTTSGSSTTVRVNPSSVTLMGQFTSLALTNPTTIQVAQQWPTLRLISTNANPITMLLGNNAAGTTSGIGFQNGSVSTSAFISHVSNTGIMQLSVKGKDLITLDAGTQGGVGISCITPTAALSISSAAGYAGSLFNGSTGTFKIWDFTGSSVVFYVPVISQFGVAYPTSSTGGGGGAADGASGFTLWAATAPTNSIVLGSATVVGTITSTAGAILGGTTVQSLNVAGAVGSMTGTNGVITILGNLAFQTTWYTGIAFPVSVGSVGMQNSINFSTNNMNGRALFDGTAAGSATTSAAFYQKSIPQNFIFGTTPTITRFVDFSTGVTTQNRAYIISFATAAQHEQAQNLVYTSTVIYTVSGNTPVAGGAVTTKTRITVPSLTNLIGNGDRVLWIRVARDGDNTVSDPAQSNSVLIDEGIAIGLQF